MEAFSERKYIRQIRQPTAVGENKKAVRSEKILTAQIYWLPSADSNHGPDG
jgi:hypothetical protein